NGKLNVYRQERAPLFFHSKWDEIAHGWFKQIIFAGLQNIFIKSLSQGQHFPSSGTTTDQFYFSANYKDESGNSPQAVSLKINGYTMPMDLESGIINTGAIYSLSYANSTPGTYNYYFEATTASGEVLRYPASGYLQLTISESTAGWEMIAYSIDATPKYMVSAKSVSVTVEILNMSNSTDKIYYNLPYKFEMFGPSGNLEDQKSGTIAQANKGSILKVQTSLTPNNINGSHQIVFTVYPNKDTDFSNNSKSIPIIIGSDGPTREYHISDDWAWVWMDVTDFTL
ncbi:MAG: hypothetical protein K0B11_21715, partial [Mariniphaga sp.]|nr:hypothetical protein [Mariniphaga sp.]